MDKPKSSAVVPILLVFSLCLVSGCAGQKQAQPQKAPEMDSTTRARMAESLLQAGRISEALATINEAVEMDPENPTLHHYRGMILFRAGRYDDATPAFERVLQLDPYFTDAHNFLGAVYSEQGRLNEAEKEYNLALADPAYPTPELVYLNLAMLYKKQGRDEEALRHLRTAVEINPKYYQAHYELASLLDRMDKLDEAVRIYEVAEPGYRSSADFYYRFGLAYFRLGQNQKSMEKLMRAIDVAPGSESAARADELLKMID